MTETKHRYDIDLCRAIACLMAIGTHIPEICPADTLTPFVYDLRLCFSYLCRAVNPLFFMITGCLYLGKESADLNKTVKKAGKLLLMFLIWSALYLIRSQLLFHTYHSFNEFYTVLFAGHYHLWFLTALASAYFFLPLLHGAVHGQKVSLKYILVLFTALAIVKYNAEMFIPQNWRGPFTMFTTDVVPTLVYMVFGYWLSRREITGKHIAVLGIITLLTLPLSVWLTENFTSVFPDLVSGIILPPSYMSFLGAAFTFALCMYMVQRGKKPGTLMMQLSSLSLGIYLIHPFVIDEIKRLEYIGAVPALFTENLQFLRLPFAFVITAILSFALSFVLKKIPVLKKLITI